VNPIPNQAPQMSLKEASGGFITAGPSTKLFTWGGGGIWEVMCYERLRAEACVD
jgi:hypothetical protein